MSLQFVEYLTTAYLNTIQANNRNLFRCVYAKLESAVCGSYFLNGVEIFVSKQSGDRQVTFQK